EAHGQRLAPEALPLALVADHGDCEAADLRLAELVGLLLVVEIAGLVALEKALEAGNDPLVAEPLLLAATLADDVVGLAEEDALAHLVVEIAEGRVGVDPEGVDRPVGLGGERQRAASPPGEDGPLAQGARRIGHDAGRIDAAAHPEPAAGGTGPVRAVEREHPRLDRRQRHPAADAGEALAHE